MLLYCPDNRARRRAHLMTSIAVLIMAMVIYSTRKRDLKPLYVDKGKL